MTVTNKINLVKPPIPNNINNYKPDEVPEAVYLGVAITKKYLWKPHIKTVTVLRKNFQEHFKNNS